jgi:hypothetical protein
MALADREAETVLREEAKRSLTPEITPDELQSLVHRVSPKAYALIVRHETGGRDYYEKVYKARPVWPAGSSGVTIGFGYDLGYQTSAEAFRADWGGLLPPAHIDMLARAVGLQAVDPDRAQKVDQLKGLVKALVETGVTIPWEPSETVFQKVTMPRFAAVTSDALPGSEALSDDCFGALVSLTFNRGPSFGRAQGPNDTLDRYREMRGIKQALADSAIEHIPGLIRDMKRIWKGTIIEAEMNRRRENEARLFEEGLVPVVLAELDERTRSARGGLAGLTRGGPLARRAPAEPIHGFVPTGIIDDQEALDPAEERKLQDFSLETRRAAPSVRWAADKDAPDYAHLASTPPTGIRFPLRADDLAWLAELNGFPVAEAGSAPILFGLRGCGIVEAPDGLASEVELVDQRPDHSSARCAIGVWDRAAGRIAAFPASTVPNANAVTAYFEGRAAANMLPTGFYRYIVGKHATQSNPAGWPGCFLLRHDNGEHREVVVRRSKNNLCYERIDMVDPAKPGDNIHPTASTGTAWYSSYGCQVVVGTANNDGSHNGPWARFRRAAGQNTATGRPGRYHYMLLTGLEALLASRARRDQATAVPEVRSSLERLRFGSSGPKVARLRAYLGLSAGEDFDLETALKVHALHQQSWNGASDGIFTPALDAALGAWVFSEKPAEPAVVPSETDTPDHPPMV